MTAHSLRGYVPGTPWTDAERQQLRRLHSNGLGQAEIGRMMGRSKNSIHRQLATLGLIRNDKNSAAVTAAPGHAVHRAPRTTLPPLPSLRTDSE